MADIDENRPVCKCHGLPMWKSQYKWRCREKTLERQRKYRKTTLKRYVIDRRNQLKHNRKEIVNKLKEIECLTN